MNIAIAVISESRNVQTLPHTLESMRLAGFNPPNVIVAEPGTNITGVHATVCQHNFELGPVKNWTFALQWLLDHTDAEHVAVFRDDIELKLRSANAITCLLDKPLGTDIGFLSLYSSRSHKSYMPKAGWNKCDIGKKMLGVYALIFPRTAAAMLLSCSSFRDKFNFHVAKRDIDALVGGAMADLGKLGLWYNPSLCRCIGAGDLGDAIGFTTPSTLVGAKIGRGA